MIPFPHESFSRERASRLTLVVPLLALFVPLLLLVVPAPVDAGAEEAVALYSKGREHLLRGDTLEARRAFENAVKASPVHLESRYQLALVYARSIATYGNAEEILFDLPAASAHAGRDVRNDLMFRAAIALGKLNIRMGKPRQAASLLRNAILAAPPGLPLDEAYNALGLALYHDRLYDDAIFDLRRATQANPGNVFARFNIKSIRARMEHFQAGKIYSRAGNHAEAADMFRKAIALDPRFVEARHRLGVELHETGNDKEALKELHRAEAIGSEYRKLHEIYLAQGLSLVSLGRSDEALERFLKAASSRAAFAPAYNEIGKIYVETGKFSEAVEIFVKAIGIDPRTEYVRNLQIAMARRATSPGPSPRH